VQKLFDLVTGITNELYSTRLDIRKRLHLFPTTWRHNAHDRCRTLAHEACWSLTDKVQVLRRITSVAELEQMFEFLSLLQQEKRADPKHSKIVVWIDEDVATPEGLTDDDCERLNRLMEQLQKTWPNTLFLMTSNKPKSKKFPSFLQHSVYIEGTTKLLF